ncbi:MAG: hypothetical protein AAGL69_14900 [Pseudomonadota bacterium]
MLRRIFIGVLVVCVVACGSRQAEEAGITSADQFVETLGLGDNFSGICYGATLKTTTFATIVEELGLPEARKLVSGHLDASIAARQSTWNQNLNAVYREFFSDAELISLANEKASSPFTQKFQRNRGPVGGRMQELSSELVEETIKEALTKAYNEMTDARGE